MKATSAPVLLPRLLRFRDAPRYLGMDRNRFNAEVRPCVTRIPIGRQGIAFDRLELDAWVDDYKSRNGRRLKASKPEDERMSKKQSRMPGLRKRNGIWHIEKRCRYAPGGWLHESTGTSSRVEAEQILIRRLAKLEEEARRQTDAIFLFEQAALRYLEEVAEKSSADTIAMHLDQLLPFIGNLPLAQVHDGTIEPFVKHERARGSHPSRSTTPWAVSQRS